MVRPSPEVQHDDTFRTLCERWLRIPGYFIHKTRPLPTPPPRPFRNIFPSFFLFLVRSPRTQHAPPWYILAWRGRGTKTYSFPLTSASTTVAPKGDEGWGGLMRWVCVLVFQQFCPFSSFSWLSKKKPKLTCLNVMGNLWNWKCYHQTRGRDEGVQRAEGANFLCPTLPELEGK